VAYLSRIWLNPRRAQGSRLLRDPQALHAAVLAGVPAQPVVERVLWRVDPCSPSSAAGARSGSRDHPTDRGSAFRAALFVVTRSKPSWEHLVEQAGWPSADDATDPQAVTRPYEILLDALTTGHEYAFRLTANPTRAVRNAKTADGSSEAVPRRSARLGHSTVVHQVDWLLARASGCGFSIPNSSASAAVGEGVPDLRVIGRQCRSFYRGRDHDRHRVTLQTVTYEGRLTVEDPALMREKLLDGIGRAKAYGCGLLTLAGLHPGS